MEGNGPVIDAGFADAALAAPVEALRVGILAAARAAVALFVIVSACARGLAADAFVRLLVDRCADDFRTAGALFLFALVDVAIAQLSSFSL